MGRSGWVRHDTLDSVRLFRENSNPNPQGSAKVKDNGQKAVQYILSTELFKLLQSVIVSDGPAVHCS